MLTAYTDGGARGNPGPAGYGVQVVDESGLVVAELHDGLGRTTNNVAEYRGLLAALSWAVANHASPLRIRMDSELIVNQMTGRYKVKHPGLQPLHAEAKRLVSQVGRVVFEHVRRDQNREADRLSNLGMDLAEGRPHPPQQPPAQDAERRVQAPPRPQPASLAGARPARLEFDVPDE